MAKWWSFCLMVNLIMVTVSSITKAEEQEAGDPITAGIRALGREIGSGFSKIFNLPAQSEPEHSSGSPNPSTVHAKQAKAPVKVIKHYQSASVSKSLKPVSIEIPVKRKDQENVAAGYLGTLYTRVGYVEDCRNKKSNRVLHASAAQTALNALDRFPKNNFDFDVEVDGGGRFQEKLAEARDRFKKYLKRKSDADNSYKNYCDFMAERETEASQQKIQTVQPSRDRQGERGTGAVAVSH